MSEGYLWFDFENAPHVWILSPIIQHFQEKGYKCLLTARDFSYTVGLCSRLGYDARVVGQAGMARNTLRKTMRILERATQLCCVFAKNRKSIRLAISHGSRSQLLASRILGISAICIDDYEYSYQGFSRFADNILVPFPIDKNIWGRYASRVAHYPGLKEELYLRGFSPDSDCIPGNMGAQSKDILVLFRPSGTWSHYKSKESSTTQQSILEYLSKHPNVYLVLLPRHEAQGDEMKRFCAERGVRFCIPGQTLDGPQLIWNMDLVIGGGGTMTREAAVLGVPSYSFFGGQWGGVDAYLESCGLLVAVRSPNEVERIALEKRNRLPPMVSSQALDFVTSFIESRLNSQELYK